MNETALEIKLVEELERTWASRRKNEIFRCNFEGETYVSLAWEHGPVKVIVSAIVGVRGRITEQVIAVDSSMTRSVLDRLITWRRVASEGFFLPLYDMRSKQRKERLQPIDLCQEAMENFLEEVRHDPAGLISNMRNKALDTGESVSTVTGGLPSLGWNSR